MELSSDQTCEHLLCPWCEYDLYGLPTRRDSVWCPECGRRVNFVLLRSYDAGRGLSFRDMMTWQIVCAVLFALIPVPRMVFFAGVMVLPVLLGLAFLGGWVVSSLYCAYRYRPVGGFWGIFGLLHAGVILLGFGLVAILENPGPVEFIAVGLIVLGLGWGLYWLGRRLVSGVREQFAVIEDGDLRKV